MSLTYCKISIRSSFKLNLLCRLIEYISKKPGVKWVTMADICDDFKAKNKPVKGAIMPAEHGAIAKNPSKSMPL